MCWSFFQNRSTVGVSDYTFLGKHEGRPETRTTTSSSPAYHAQLTGSTRPGCWKFPQFAELLATAPPTLAERHPDVDSKQQIDSDRERGGGGSTRWTFSVQFFVWVYVCVDAFGFLWGMRLFKRSP